MFKNVGARFVLRAAFAGVLALLASTTTALVDGHITLIEALVISNATLTVVGTYAGVGAATPQLEPNIGNRLDG